MVDPSGLEAQSEGVVRALSLWMGDIHVPTPMAKIKFDVARKYGVRVEDLEGPSAAHCYAHPRHEAMALCRAVLDDRGRPRFSFPMIGRAFGGRDHTTVMYAIRSHKARQAQARGVAA